MISFEKALDIVLAHAVRLPVEKISLADACGRILALNVVSDIDIPHADLSAMDGFACRKADIDKPLKVLETIPAGHAPLMKVGTGECSRIMTGAVVPDGADHVVMVEHASRKNETVCVTTQSKSDNIRHAAEDVHKGDVVAGKGSRITPAVMAVLAMAGRNDVVVYNRVRVGIIATGDELVEIGLVPGPAQIRNSNSCQLGAQTLGCGCAPEYFGIVHDSPTATGAMIEKALTESDVVLLSGGISAGDFDFVPATLRKRGVDIKFQGVAMKPGKPVLFGVLDDKAVFGLGGNPVSTFVAFELLVRPFLLKCMGHRYRPLVVKARLQRTFVRKNVDRMEFVPIRFDDDGFVALCEYHGSAHIHAYCSAQGILALPQGTCRIDEGSEINVRIL